MTPERQADADEGGRETARRWQPRPGTAHHILPAAGTMIGVSVTLIGLVKIAEGRIGPSRVDEYGGLSAVVFLVSALASYLSIRMQADWPLSLLAERIADFCFLAGLVGITVVAVFFAYEVV